MRGAFVDCVVSVVFIVPVVLIVSFVLIVLVVPIVPIAFIVLVAPFASIDASWGLLRMSSIGLSRDVSSLCVWRAGIIGQMACRRACPL